MLHEEELSRAVIGAAIEVHRELGPGLLESDYERCLQYEMNRLGIEVCRQVPLPVMYKGQDLDCELRLDLLVPDRLIVEVKSVEQFHPVHEAHLLTYLRLSGIRLGLLINFIVALPRGGLKRLIV